MLKSLIAFGVGCLCGALLMYLAVGYLGVNADRSPVGRELSTRIESIPIESICNSISSGKQMLGDDHVTVWSDRKRYLVAGWRVKQSGIPVFYWTGADLPDDVPGCKK
jgi:hypothetical protein